MKNLICFLIFISCFSFKVQAQSKEYTGESIEFINDDGFKTRGWIPGKYNIVFNGKKYGSYESEAGKVTKTTAFDDKKYNQDSNNKSQKVEAFGGKLFDSNGKEIGKFRMTGAQGEFTFHEPYKVLYIKGRNGKKMAEQLIDEGYIK